MCGRVPCAARRCSWAATSLVQFIGFATGLVLARLLTPADFGITTLGLTIVGAANVIADGGIAASLISRKEPPTTAELRAVNGFQLALTLAITAIAVPIGFALGGDGPATAIILLSLPLYAVRTPPMLLFERRLQFAPRIIIQVAELVTYGVVAIALALMGLGVWAMPLALVARAVAGTVYCYVLSPTKWVLPTLRFRLVRPLLGFGVRFQMKSIVQLVRDIAVVSVVGSLGGLSEPGFLRVLHPPAERPEDGGDGSGRGHLPRVLAAHRQRRGRRTASQAHDADVVADQCPHDRAARGGEPGAHRVLLWPQVDRREPGAPGSRHRPDRRGPAWLERRQLPLRDRATRRRRCGSAAS